MAMEDKRIVRIEGKIDKLGEQVSSINVTLSAQHESLKEHMRRTSILEESLEPLKKHDYMWLGAFKVFFAVASIIGIGEGISAILEYLGK